MSGVHQFVPMLHRYDAVGEHTRALRDLLVGSGMASRIYTELTDPGTASETLPYRSYADHAEVGDVLVYQFATESSMAGWLAGRQERLVLNYHSITPPEYFAPWNDGIARLQVEALAELEMLAPRADLGIAVSRFDQDELVRSGCSETVVIPVANVADPPLAPEPTTLARLLEERALRQRRGPGCSWLSVGRLAPNKGHHHTVAALFVARMTGEPGVHLTLIGSPTEPAYARALRRYVARLGLEDAVDFVSGISDADLAAYYEASDVLVMLSDHEGFGVPLVEAMGHGLVVVGYQAGAVPEVVGAAGVLLEHKHPRSVAVAVHRLMEDASWRETLIARGSERFRAMELGSAGKRLMAAVRLSSA